jgi:hypothetical protein
MVLDVSLVSDRLSGGHATLALTSFQSHDLDMLYQRYQANTWRRYLNRPDEYAFCLLLSRYRPCSRTPVSNFTEGEYLECCLNASGPETQEIY